MKITQVTAEPGVPTAEQLNQLGAAAPHLLLVFGDVAQLDRSELLPALRRAVPGAVIAGCSTAGEIGGGCVHEGSLVLTALHFDDPGVALATTELASMDDSRAAGERLGRALAGHPLRAVLIFGQGVAINGSALIDGIVGALPAGVKVSGGLAGDGGAFRRTLTVSTDAIGDRQIVAVGLFGSRTQVLHGSMHGWQPFGPARKVTRAEGNVLYELDNAPALDVYKRYLGEHAAGLPASGLLFPFEMLGPDRVGHGLIRTILGIDEQAGSLVLAGDIVPDGYLRLMHASIDALVEGAQKAAVSAHAIGGPSGDTLALLVSCVGRKLVMGMRTDEEIEAVADALGHNVTVTGFYSYGEIGPVVGPDACLLHNQTMTVTHLCEAAA